ncbi:MAG: hypothetical protein Q7L55_01995, partial [Actinomycetota bacterium]|nr:hypothetical protein [Actinomycetota bacterium]
DVDTTITGGAFALTFDHASVSGDFELTGAGSNLGVNAGAIADTMFEVGGSASISGAFTFGNNSATGAIDTSDWDISATGALTNISLDANGTGNTITNIDNADLTADTLDFTAISDSPTLDANLNITRAGFYIGLGGAPSTVFEVQGTSSASYLLAGNTLQVGGFSSAAYSRFGVATATSAEIDTINDLLIVGALEVDGNVFFDGKASIASNFQTAGRFIFGDSGDTGEINTSDWDISATGALTNITGITNDGAYTQTGTSANALTGLTTFSGGVSVSTNFELTGDTRLGINAGGNTETSLEVGGAASISGNITTLGTIVSTAAGSSSFSGSLDVTKGFSFFGEIRPDGLDCANGQILKKTGAEDWDCAADNSGSVTSNSLNFDEFQTALVVDVDTTITGGAFALTFDHASVSGDFELTGAGSNLGVNAG